MGVLNCVKNKSLSPSNVAVVKDSKECLNSKSSPILREAASNSVSFSTQSDIANINRNNNRLWGNLDCEAESKIWKSMEALGVVHMGYNQVILERLETMEKEALLKKGNRKEKKIGSL